MTETFMARVNIFRLVEPFKIRAAEQSEWFILTSALVYAAIQLLCPIIQMLCKDKLSKIALHEFQVKK